MARRMSFSATIDAMRTRTKLVTRRIGWVGLAAGDELIAVEKAQGLKRGERQREIGRVVVVDSRVERLDAVTDADVELEGLPGLGAAGFVDLFTRINRCDPSAEVTRIEFRHAIAPIAATALIARATADGSEIIATAPTDWANWARTLLDSVDPLIVETIPHYSDMVEVLLRARFVLEVGPGPNAARASGLLLWSVDQANRIRLVGVRPRSGQCEWFGAPPVAA